MCNKTLCPGVHAPNKEENFPIGGIEYTILEHVDNQANGYQGTIYQKVCTGEIIVAHNGPDLQGWRDNRCGHRRRIA